LVPEQGQTFSAPGDAMEVEELGKIFINNNDTKDTNDNDNLNNDDRNHDDSDSDGKTGSQEIQQSKRRLQPETPLPQIKRSKRMADKSPKHKSRRHHVPKSPTSHLDPQEKFDRTMQARKSSYPNSARS
jgi:hypothetical protein